MTRRGRRAAAAGLAAAVVLVPGPPSWGAAGDEAQEVRRLEQTFFPGDATAVHLGLAFGDVSVSATDGRDVEVELSLRCTRSDLDKCRRDAERLRLVARSGGGTLDVRVGHTPRARLGGVRAAYRVRVPRQLAVEVDVRVGDVEVTYPRQAVGAVHVDVGVGHATLWVADGKVEGSGVLRSINWQGPGATRLDVSTGTGDAVIHLE